MKLRILLVTVIVGAAALVPGVAWAKGAKSATITGPGLEQPVHVGHDPRTAPVTVSWLSRVTGLYFTAFRATPSPTQKRPDGKLGPRYRAEFEMYAAADKTVTFRQDLYPFAAVGFVTYTRPGQAIFGSSAPGGWYVTSDALGEAESNAATEMMIKLGARRSKAVVGARVATATDGANPAPARARAGKSEADPGDAHVCKAGPKPTPKAKLPAGLRSVDSELIGTGVLWAAPIGEPRYLPGGGWTRRKVAWFRLAEGPLEVTGRRVDGGAATFVADLPPVESYPLDLNLHIGKGFIPSHLDFSTGGCWKVTARLGTSSLVQYVDIDDSTRAICAQLAERLVANARLADQRWSQQALETITADQRAHRCPV
jgi:hypothetical protein